MAIVTITCIVLSALPLKGLAADYMGLAMQSASTYVNATMSREQGFLERARMMEGNYTSYMETVELNWGSFFGSTPKVWVDYGNGMQSRSTVDYEKGEFTLEALVPADVQDPVAVATPLIQAQVERVVHEQDAQGINPLEGQVKIDDSTSLSKNNIPAFIHEKIRQRMQVQALPALGKDGVERKVVRAKVKMIPEHVRIRAEKFKPLVMKYAAKRNLDPAIIFAIIHTESFFNPMARSHVPAYGLMQLVPSSGGRDAYKYVYGVDMKPDAAFLYDPENNIDLGTAYFELVMNRNLEGIHNVAIAYVMTIAAYNTGSGNVARALTGARKLDKAINEANRMDIVQIYNILAKQLPSDETKGYVKDVLTRSVMYRSLDAGLEAHRS
ncbi:MAG: transglycosylase SLT domain-containing protein [Desulfovibrionaceae bacterium]